MLKTAIVILNWNGLEYLKQFLGTTVMLSGEADTAVFVADNCSTDGSAEWVEANFKQVKIIRLDKNYGFAGGYNLALEQINATYFILLNSDIEVTPGWLKPMTGFLDSNPDAASCQPKILSYHNRQQFEHAGAAGGYIDRLGYPFCRGRILHFTETDSGQYDGNAARIFWSSGACMMIRAEVWKKAGGFDPSFFAHMEEIDLCWRLGKLGYGVYCIPQSAVYHVGGGSLPYSSPFKTYLNYRNSLFMLYKNLPDTKLKQTILARKILDGMSALRFIAKLEFANFTAVIKAHASCRKIKKTLIANRSPTTTTSEKAIPSIFGKSIISEYYLKRHRTFGSLKWKPLNHETGTASEAIESMFNSIAGKYDFLNHLLSFGIDRCWRRKAVKTIARHYKNPYILDVATGTADLAIEAAKATGAKVVGVDISGKMLQAGREKILRHRLAGQIGLVKAGAEAIPFPANIFDVAMVAFGVRNFANPQAGLHEMHRTLKSGGMIMVLEFSRPRGLFRYLYGFYFTKILPFIGRLFSGNKKAYTYLPHSVLQFPDNEAFVEMLSAAGFSGVSQTKLTAGIASIYTGFKPPAQ